MQTLMLQNKPRKGTSGSTWLIEVLGPDGPAKDEFKKAIQELEHHPAKAARRSIIDMLGLIQQFRFDIKFTEHFRTDDGLEGWTFILQG